MKQDQLALAMPVRETREEDREPPEPVPKKTSLASPPAKRTEQSGLLVPTFMPHPNTSKANSSKKTQNSGLKSLAKNPAMLPGMKSGAAAARSVSSASNVAQISLISFN